ncbi:flagellar motor protein MotB [Sneathiella chinensis]|uniref:Chemotaxis protein MotB n=1 Tax=Sneathiella chinensis TaxID=349750 RepID=A0ABQ5U3F9_9PROT|nr:flagellar motor protein MotB [Sneathiella chinensis]GLQ06449.1 chemotaxis protein MotB [Sneathiella chinensis]
MADDAKPIIVKKVKKGGHGHHGGAWKVAYADFVTAMMAFFLLLWLLNVTDAEQKKGISEYFAPTMASSSRSGAGGILGGQSMQTEGAMVSNTGVPSVVSSISPPEEGRKDDAKEDSPSEIDETEFLERLAELEERAFDHAKEQIKQAISSDPELEGLADNIIIDMTPEGLRIQIVDQYDESMFESGSAKISPRVKRLLGKIAKAIEDLPNGLSISGHTDSAGFASSTYGNWELSSDRANASRRALMEGGLDIERIRRVSGKADQEPLIADDPSNPGNRRISIILLREAPVLPPDLK